MEKRENTLEMVAKEVEQLIELCKENNLTMTLAILEEGEKGKTQVATGGDLLDCYRGSELIKADLDKALGEMVNGYKED